MQGRDLGRTPRYHESHAHLSFTVNLTTADPELWMLLGEARSKCEHLAQVPLRPSTRDELHVLYLAKGVHGTAAIEGNTLTENEVHDHLLGKLRLPPSQSTLTLEIDNIVAAFNWLKDEVFANNPKLTPQMICDINATVLQGLILPDEVRPGQLRTHDVAVGNYKAIPAEDCGPALQQMCAWLTGPDFEPKGTFGTSLDILRAIIAHLYIAWIHPFGDGNGRTARLVELMILLAAGVPQPASHLLSNHYNRTREEYYRRLDEARISNAYVLEFIRYSVSGFVDELRLQIEVVRRQMMEQAWEDMVEGTLRNRSGPTAARQRAIARELGRRDEPTPRAVIRRMTGELADMYAGKTMKTVTRDLNALAAEGLIERVETGWIASKHVLDNLLPARSPGHDTSASGAA